MASDEHVRPPEVREVALLESRQNGRISGEQILCMASGRAHSREESPNNGVTVTGLLQGRSSGLSPTSRRTPAKPLAHSGAGTSH